MIVIIGGSGFVGTRLSIRLSQSQKLFQILDKAPSYFFPERVLSVDISLPLSMNFSFLGGHQH